MPTTPQQRQTTTAELVEQMGVFFQSEGFSRIAGRIFGRLLLSEEPLSLQGLARELRVSRASISVDTRFLVHRGLVERVGRPGDRRAFYRIAPELPLHTMQLRLERMRKFNHLVREAHASGTFSRGPVKERLEEIGEAYAYFLKVLAQATADWRDRATTS